MEKKYQIALDGPAGAGKSTITKKLASKLGFFQINSGGIFRSITYFLKTNGISLDDHDAIVKVLPTIQITQKEGVLLLNNEDVTKNCYTTEISNLVPKAAQIIEIRDKCRECQLNLAKDTNIVIEGRDTTTEVFPKAILKVYVTADPKLRAQRRWEQIGKVGSFEEVYNDLVRRDEMDMTRTLSPLKKADDAFVLDTTGKMVDECVTIISDEFFKRVYNEEH